MLRDRSRLIEGRHLGLLCNPTSVDSSLNHAQRLLPAAGARLRAVFGPEHGVGGTAQDMIAVDGDAFTDGGGPPTYSLYGAHEATLAPKQRWLEGLDAVVIDLQDIGARYYTYVWTAALMLRACAEAGVQAIVCDRPNPLGGAIEGPSIEAGFESFVGLHPVCVRHGLTIGELCRLYAAEQQLDVDLEVIELGGWRRDRPYEQLGLPWILPSPNMPTLDTAWVYPGGCLLEGTSVSEGRGTTRPFEIVGAPFVDGGRWAVALNNEALPGVRFRPLSFQPTFQKHAGEVCGGVQLHVTDRAAFAPLRTGVALLATLQRCWPEAFGWRAEAYEFVTDRPAIDLLAGGTWLREGVCAGASLDELCAGWGAAERAFGARRRPFLLYSDGA
ncbi:MAG: hypothetical protein CSA65_00815 [Proteobacteria bacterium]|nr:MAG: hypothetical protein CSB49_07895 [Pseudomonadota bacterium]PIE19843.1 MAG: hypothetical protein CSA65_00815 [Pseudomonadota bacterium]